MDRVYINDNHHTKELMGVSDQDLPMGVTRNPDGSFSMFGIAARVGVQKYPFGRVLRTPDSLEELTPKLVGLPVTIEHPVERKVNDGNKRRLARGEIMDATFDREKGLVVVQMRTDSSALKAIKDGMNQLSIGQDAKRLNDRGVWVDESGVAGLADNTYEHDFRFEDIEPNHIALTDSPRAGDVAGLFITNNVEDENMPNTEELNSLQTLISGLQAGLAKLNDDFSKAITATDSKILEVSKELLDVKKETATVLDSINAKLDASPEVPVVEKPAVVEEPALDSETPDINDLVTKELQARSVVLAAINDSNPELLKLNSVELQKKFITDSTNIEDLGAYSNEQLSAMFDVLVGMKKPEVINDSQGYSDNTTSTATTVLTEALDSNVTQPQTIEPSQRLAQARLERSRKMNRSI